MTAERPAYVLGSVAPDARVDAPDPRAATHFYTYTEPFAQHPWMTMLERYPSLTQPKSAAHRAFIAGYVAHLAMDQVWSVDMLAPHFAAGTWGENRRHRFLVLHTLLIDMDKRDLASLPAWIPEALCQAAPDDWLPFMPQDALTDWQTLIYEQIKPGGASKTLEIFGERVSKTPDELRQILHDPAWMQQNLWDHVPRVLVASVEAEMTAHARDSLVRYLREFAETP